MGHVKASISHTQFFRRAMPLDTPTSLRKHLFLAHIFGSYLTGKFLQIHHNFAFGSSCIHDASEPLLEFFDEGILEEVIVPGRYTVIEPIY